MQYSARPREGGDPVSKKEKLDSRFHGNDRSVEPAYASQAAFRALMDCMARPGDVRSPGGVEAPAPFAPATAALIKSLADYETPLWLDPAFAAEPKVADWIRFHAAAPVTREPGEAAFALIADARALPDFAQFAQGTAEYPDRSTTLLVQVDGFTGAPLTLRGPGVKTTRDFAASPLPADFTARVAANRALFPRGVDIVLVAGRDIAALPRSVTIVER